MDKKRPSNENLGEIEKGQIVLLSAAHLINDSYAGFLAPLLPLLVDKFSLSLTAAGFLSSALAFSSSLAQPFYGYLADRFGRRYFVVLGPLITSIFMSFLGLPESYTLLVMFVLLGGMGTAFFHPQGAAFAGATGGSRKGFSMSFFSASGNAGYALGPLFIVSLVSLVGFKSTYIAVIPGVFISLLLLRYVSRTSSPPVPTGDSFKRQLTRQFKPVLFLWLIVVLRALVVTSFGTFIPLLIKERKYSLMMGGTSIFIFLFCGALGGLLGGYLSDRIGRKRIILISLVFATPFLLAFLYASDVLALVSLGLAGAFLLSSIPVGLVMAQEIMPNRASTVSGLMIGFGWGMGGLAVSLVGMIADAMGLTSALAIVALLPVLGCICGLGLPDREMVI